MPDFIIREQAPCLCGCGCSTQVDRPATNADIMNHPCYLRAEESITVLERERDEARTRAAQLCAKFCKLVERAAYLLYLSDVREHPSSECGVAFERVKIGWLVDSGLGHLTVGEAIRSVLAAAKDMEGGA
jgi:hypothetical protein